MSIIASGTTTTTALVSTGNTDGTLQLQVNGTTPSVTLNALGAVGVGSTPGYGTTGQVLTSAGSSSAPTWSGVNLPGGSQGSIPYQSASGTTALLAAGTSGQVLTTQGAGANPTWTTPSTGAMTLVSTQTASNSASIQWTGLTSNRYQIILENVNNNGSAFYMQFGYGATPTWITTGYYWLGITTNASSGSNGSVTNTSFNTGNSTGFYSVYYMNNGGNSNINVINITGCTNGASQTYTAMGQSYTGTTTWFYNNFSGAIVNSNNVTAIRFISASGNISSGVFSLYTIAQ